MKTAHFLLVGLVALGTPLAACSSDSGSDGGTRATGPAVDELPPLLAEAFCTSYEACLGDATDLFLAGQDCRELFEPSVAEGEFGLLQQAIDQGTVTYTPSRVQECLDEITALRCEFQGSWYSETCEAAITGNVAEGGDCTIDMECAGDRVCRIDNACPGTCGPRGEAGDECEDDDDCAAGLTCADSDEAQPGQCVESLGEDRECSEPLEPCAAGLMCANADGDDTTPDTCTPIDDVFSVAEGADCAPWAGTFCVTGQNCVIELGLLGVPSATCSADQAPRDGDCQAALPDQCPDGQYCAGIVLGDGLDPVVEGTCTDLPEAGDACLEETFGGPDCAADHTCVNGTCMMMRAIGGNCQSDDQCYSDNCDAGGTCALYDPCST